MSILVLADHDQGRLSPSTASAVAAARKIGDDVEVLVAGSQLGEVSQQAAAIEGVSKVRVADSPAFSSQAAESLARLLEGMSANYTHILASAGTVGRDTMPRLAAILDVSPVTDITAIFDATRFERPVYAGNALQTVISEQHINVLTVRASAFEPANENGGSAAIEPANAADFDSVVSLIETIRTQSDVPDLGSARIVVAGGQSFGSAENFKMLESLAATLGAAIGATRAAVDAGYAPNDWQVGQTGKIIAPDLYIAIGISGALQHLAGIQRAKKIIAINTDPEAPMMKLADLALVGDLFETVPALTEALQTRLQKAS